MHTDEYIEVDLGDEEREIIEKYISDNNRDTNDFEFSLKRYNLILDTKVIGIGIDGEDGGLFKLVIGIKTKISKEYEFVPRDLRAFQSQVMDNGEIWRGFKNQLL